MQAATLFHELGHNFELRHGGPPVPVEGEGEELQLQFQPNCKPNQLSSMNYLFQLYGLYPTSGPQTQKQRIDFSRVGLGSLAEGTLFETAGLPGGAPYRTAWFAPRIAGTLGFVLKTPAAKKHCDGSPLSPEEEADRLAGNGVARIDGLKTTIPIDWNADGSIAGAIVLPGPELRRHRH